ncbi:GNAT family N-acetyltransferase [Shouchella lehensis]|uniref:GNAT family N-acetyltransferase n=1 Tax=Shouchella lehensis TaxID=300825 RepID=UPI0014197EC6|nr:GNAT family N-acetyltransferase [Shouchella lehensis]
MSQSSYSDKPYLAQLRMNVLQADFDRLQLPYERVFKRFEENFHPEHIYLIKVDEVGTIGCIGIIEHNDYVELKNFYIEPSFQGNGMGRAVFQHVVEHYKDKREISLKIFKGSRAKPLYESFGFTVKEQNERVETMSLNRSVHT